MDEPRTLVRDGVTYTLDEPLTLDALRLARAPYGDLTIPAPEHVTRVCDPTGTLGYVWRDDNGVVRVRAHAPTEAHDALLYDLAFDALGEHAAWAARGRVQAEDDLRRGAPAPTTWLDYHATPLYRAGVQGLRSRRDAEACLATGREHHVAQAAAMDLDATRLALGGLARDVDAALADLPTDVATPLAVERARARLATARDALACAAPATPETPPR